MQTANAKFFLDMTLAFSNANALTILQQIRSGKFVIGCYCWGKKVILVVDLNLNQ